MWFHFFQFYCLVWQNLYLDHVACCYVYHISPNSWKACTSQIGFSKHDHVNGFK